jgi:hypothetical protein
MEHFNPKEKESLQEICFDYMDEFFLPGDQLSCKNAVKHLINLEPGSNTINTSDACKGSIASLEGRHISCTVTSEAGYEPHIMDEKRKA